MGRVYEALKRAKVEDKPAGWSSVPVGHPPTRDSQSKKNTNGAHKLDFIDYSLNAADPFEIERQNREIVNAEAIRKSLVKPTSEILLDKTRLAPQLSSFQDANTDAAEEYNKLAVMLVTTACERPLKRVLVASAQHGEGRSSITLNLACALARAQRRVLVVDADLQGSSLLGLLGLSGEMGPTDVPTKGLASGSTLIRIQPFGLDLLSGRENVKSQADLLSPFSFGENLELFDPDYDFILFDSPPLLKVADSSLLIRHTDATVLVIRSGKTTSGQIGRAIARLAPEKILGVVLNRADRSA